MVDQKKKKALPIGVFDSGMGGLTVLRELVQHLPQENFIYLGDTARLPYGTKSADTVNQYATQMATILHDQGIKLMVVACNTATTTALPTLRKRFPDIPIVGVVEPGAQAAVKATKNNSVALLATETTIASNIYQETLLHLNPNIDIASKSCGLFVALAEEGFVDDDIALHVTTHYLNALHQVNNHFDCLILGCTHFPVLLSPIRKAIGEHVSIINSAQATAQSVAALMMELDLNAASNQGELQFLVTDLSDRFIRVGELFLGQSIAKNTVSLVDGVLEITPSSASVMRPSFYDQESELSE